MDAIQLQLRRVLAFNCKMLGFFWKRFAFGGTRTGQTEAGSCVRRPEEM